MPITVPQFQYNPAMIKAPQMQPIDLGGAIESGTNIGSAIKDRRLQGDVGGDLGEQVMGGSQEAADTLIRKYGSQGAEAVKNLMAVTSLRNKEAATHVAKKINDRAEFLAKIESEPDEGKRKYMMKKYAIDVLGSEGDREYAQDLMKASNAEDPQEMDAQIKTMIDMAGTSNEFLEAWKLETYGDTTKIREKDKAIIEKGNAAIQTRMDTILTAYDKIDSLVDQAKGDPANGIPPNRTAISSVLVGLVKLQDPNSAVLQAEMMSALNEQDPKAAIIDLLRGKNTSESAIKSVLAKLDPLSPENINPDQIRATANALVQANIPQMQAAYEDGLLKSEGLSRGGRKSIDRNRIGQRLFDMNKRFYTSDDDKNNRNLRYLEINQLRKELGLKELDIEEGQIEEVVEEVDENMRSLEEEERFLELEAKAKAAGL